MHCMQAGSVLKQQAVALVGSQAVVVVRQASWSNQTGWVNDLKDGKVCNWLIGRILSGPHEGDKGWAVFALAKELIPGGAEDGLQLVVQLGPEPCFVCRVPHTVPNYAERFMAPQLQHGILQSSTVLLQVVWDLSASNHNTTYLA